MYKKPKLSSTGKIWWVYYSFLNPETGKFELFVIKKGLNSKGLTNTQRRERASALILAITLNLQAGFNPFQKFKDVTAVNKNIILLINNYLELKKSTVRNKTYLKYKQQLTSFARWISPDLNIDQINKSHISAFLATGEKWSGKTYNHYLLTLKTFFQHYLTQYDDYLTKNPCLGLANRTTTAVGNMPINDEDMKRARIWLTENHPIVWMFCQTIYYAALRPHTEARLLQRKHLDFMRKTITVPGYLSKNRKSQTIPFDDKLINVFLAFKESDPETYIFGGKIPLSDDWFMYRFKMMKEELSMGPLISMYSFKHLRAIHLYQDTKDIEFIRKLFRHSSALTTQIYLRDLGLMTDSSNLIHSRDI